jgi:transposase InsO family protein
MADDVVTPSNPPVAPVDKEELEEAPLDEVTLEVNVSQRLREEEPSKRVVRTRVVRSAWDRRLSPNPHAFAIYLEFVPVRRAVPERFEECQCEDDDVRLHCRTWVPGDGHYRWLQGPINPLPMEHQAEYLARTIRRILEFLQL